MTPKEWEKVREELAEIDPDLILYDDLKDAFLGICRRFGQEPVAIYDYHKCIEIRMRDGATHEEAVEFHEYNTMGAGFGERTPAFVVTLDDQPLRTVRQERWRILDRAKEIRHMMGSRLRRHAQLIDFFIRELEREDEQS